MNYALTFFKSTNHGTVAQAMGASMAADGPLINYTHQERKTLFGGFANNSPAERQSYDWPLLLTEEFKYKEAVWEFLDDPFKTAWVGSDEILKFRFEGSARHPTFQPYPTVYYLPDWVRCRKILFCACLGVDPDFIPRAFYKDIGKRLEGFDILSVRDLETWQFIRNISTSLASRTQLIPDPTWLLYPNLKETPLAHYQNLQTASSYHRLIVMLMEGKQPQEVTDHRAKTKELAERFRVKEWDLAYVQKQCQREKESLLEFINQARSSPTIG